MIPTVILVSKKKPRRTQCMSLLCTARRSRSVHTGQASWWMQTWRHPLFSCICAYEPSASSLLFYLFPWLRQHNSHAQSVYNWSFHARGSDNIRFQGKLYCKLWAPLIGHHTLRGWQPKHYDFPHLIPPRPQQNFGLGPSCFLLGGVDSWGPQIQEGLTDLWGCSCTSAN